MPSQHRESVLNVGIWLCGVLGHFDAKVLQIRWRQVHLDETQVNILTMLMLRVIVCSAVPAS
jgi:hypothetical protein